MPLFHKQKLIISLILCFFFCPAAWGIDADVGQRTPVCREPKAGCAPLFYLNSRDKVQVKQQSDDGKWFFVWIAINQSEGWVNAADLKLKLPKHLKQHIQRPLKQEALFLLQSPSAALGYADHLETLDSENPLKSWDVRFFPKNFRPMMAHQTTGFLDVFGIEKQEEGLFLMRVRIGEKGYPDYHTLVHIQSEADFYGLTVFENGDILLVADSDGPWGKSQMLVLDADLSPKQLIQKPEEMLQFLPAELNAALQKQRIRWLGVLPQGEVLLGAYHLGRRRDVILRFQLHEHWSYHSAVNWPKDLPFKLFDSKLIVRAAAQGEALYVHSRMPDKKNFLSYYAGNNEPLFTQLVETDLRYLFLNEGALWSLSNSALSLWSPVFTE